jgi:hypothetical protein
LLLVRILFFYIVNDDLTMSSRELPYPLFDADNHLYEPPEAMTKYLPKGYEKAIQYVQIKGRTKIAVRGQISEYIPNPTFEVAARPGAMEDYFKHGNPEGKSRREIFGEPMRSIPVFHDPPPRLEVMDDLGIERTLMFPTLASLLGARAILVRPAPPRSPGGRGPARSRAIGQWRPVTDAVASWVCRGALFRHPELKVAVIENGGNLAWLVAA